MEVRVVLINVVILKWYFDELKLTRCYIQIGCRVRSFVSKSTIKYVHLVYFPDIFNLSKGFLFDPRWLVRVLHHRLTSSLAYSHLSNSLDSQSLSLFIRHKIIIYVTCIKQIGLVDCSMILLTTI